MNCPNALLLHQKRAAFRQLFLSIVLDPVVQDATLVVDHVSGADHEAGAAGQAFVRENEGTVLRDLDGAGGAGSLAHTAADAADLADIPATGILVGAEHYNGVLLQAQVDDTLGAGQIAGTAADALALVHLGHAVGVQGNGAETAGLDAGAAAGAAVVAQVIALGALLGTAAAVAVDTGHLGREFFLDDHGFRLLSDYLWA